MAITVADISPAGSKNRKIFSVIKSADGDASATIAHGLGVTPEEAWIVPVGAQAYPGGATGQNPRVTAKDATNVTIGLDTGAGSGNAAAQFHVIVKRPHSIMR